MSQVTINGPILGPIPTSQSKGVCYSIFCSGIFASNDQTLLEETVAKYASIDVLDLEISRVSRVETVEINHGCIPIYDVYVRGYAHILGIIYSINFKWPEQDRQSNIENIKSRKLGKDCVSQSLNLQGVVKTAI